MKRLYTTVLIFRHDKEHTFRGCPKEECAFQEKGNFCQFKLTKIALFLSENATQNAFLRSIFIVLRDRCLRPPLVVEATIPPVLSSRNSLPH
jgi:hypothetical protein